MEPDLFSGRFPLTAKGAWDHGGAPFSGEGGDVRILDASTTVNPFGPPFSMTDAISDASRSFDRYPEAWGESAVAILSASLPVPSENLVVGPGSTALLYRWMEAVRPKRLVLFEPVFSEYRKAALLYGVPCVTVPASDPIPFEGGEPPEHCRRWGIDLSSSLSIQAGDHFVLVNPVNPTGQAFARNVLLSFWDRVSSGGGSLLLDESFQDFLQEQSSLLPEVAAGTKGLSILRSLTKSTGLPGIRTGWLAGSAEMISSVRLRMGPWPIGALEESVIRHWARASDEAESLFRRVRDVRGELSARLVRLGWKVARGESPFLFVFTGWGDQAYGRRETFFLRSGLYLRVADGFGPPTGTDYIRLGFGAFRDPGKIVTLLTESS